MFKLKARTIFGRGICSRSLVTKTSFLDLEIGINSKDRKVEIKTGIFFYQLCDLYQEINKDQGGKLLKLKL